MDVWTCHVVSCSVVFCHVMSFTVCLSLYVSVGSLFVSVSVCLCLSLFVSVGFCFSCFPVGFVLLGLLIVPYRRV